MGAGVDTSMAWLRALFVLVVLSSSAWARGAVNAVIGDESWVARFGELPSEAADEDMRLRVHLEYVLAKLSASAAQAGGASEEQQAERARNLERLRVYIERGEFPRNFEVEGRRPHFIDDDGRICAVGYLIEQSAGRAVAEAINERHEWDFIPQITGIEAWVEQSGLTLTELAMIQPSYGWIKPRPRPVDERTIQQRTIIAALGGVQQDVQRCADRFGAWDDGVQVAVHVSSRGVDVGVDGGGRRLQRCVRNEVRAHVLATVFRGQRVLPMTVHYTFALDIYVDEDDDVFVEPDPRFSQPPPY